jgi:carboxymethylenebutenolidase
MTADRLPETENWVKLTQIDRRGALIGGVALAGYALAAQPVGAAIQTPADGLDAGMTIFSTGGFTMNAYRAKPKGKRNLPVIVVVQEIFGVHEWIRDICRRLARAGYYAIAPDYYQRQGDPTRIADFGMPILVCNSP